MDAKTAIEIYTTMIQQVIPFIAVWCICNIIVKSILIAGFKGDAVL